MGARWLDEGPLPVARLVRRIAAERAAQVDHANLTTADWPVLCDHAIGPPWWAESVVERALQKGRTR
jgi:hypothetical protein